MDVAPPLLPEDSFNFIDEHEMFQRTKRDLDSKLLNLLQYLHDLYPILLDKINTKHHDYVEMSRKTKPSEILKPYKSHLDSILHNYYVQRELGPLSPVLNPNIRFAFQRLEELYPRLIKKHKDSIYESRKIIFAIQNYLQLFA